MGRRGLTLVLTLAKLVLLLEGYSREDSRDLHRVRDHFFLVYCSRATIGLARSTLLIVSRAIS